MQTQNIFYQIYKNNNNNNCTIKILVLTIDHQLFLTDAKQNVYKKLKFKKYTYVYKLVNSVKL